MERLKFNTEKVLIVFRSDSVKMNGEGRILLRLYIDRRTKHDYFLHDLHPAHWNEKDGDKHRKWVKVKHPQHLALNSMLDNTLQRANQILLDLRSRNVLICKDEFEKYFIGKGRKNQKCFLEFMDSENEYDYKNKKGSYQTFKSRKSNISQIREIVGGRLAFNQLNSDMVKKVESGFIALGNIESTVSKKLKILKIYINRAIDQGLIDDNPLKNKKFKSAENKDRYLTLSEVNKLEKVYGFNQTPAFVKKALQPFLFSCFTGLRYSDVSNLKFKNIYTEKKHGFVYVRMIMQKSKKEIEIPLLENAIKYLPELDDQWPEMKVFQVYSNQPMNRYLKDAATLAGINKKISFHWSRHTFGTLAIMLGIDIYRTSKLMGHSKVATTERYAKVNDTTLFESIAKMQNALN